MKKIILLIFTICFCAFTSFGFAQATTNDTPQVEPSENVVLDVLDLKNMDALDVLRLISQKSGINIVASQNVKGRVTVYLKKVNVLDALKIIADANEWAFVRDTNIIKVMSSQEFQTEFGYKFGQETETRFRKLSHATVADVSAILNQIKSSSGKVISDDKTNSIILTDNPKKLDELEKFIKEMDVPVQTEVFNLNYAKAEDISKKVSEASTPVIGKVRFDERSNTLIVTDKPSKMSEIKRIIQAFDEKDKQVLIEAKIVQIVLSDDYKMGVDWEGIVKNYQKLDLVGHFDVLKETDPADKRGRIQVGTLSEDNFSALIHILETVGSTDILSNPRITAINNKEAKILVGSTEPYVTSTTTTTASGPGTTAESVNFIEVGVKLFVTPTVHNDGFITMKIKPEVSSKTKTYKSSSGNEIPIVETSEAETTVVVKDGVTIVIGGLIKENNERTTTKVPVLGDIPVVGAAFRSQSNKLDKTEIVIFLTPHIVNGDVDMYSESSNTLPETTATPVTQ